MRVAAFLAATTVFLSIFAGETLAASSADNVLLGRKAVPILDGEYPASYFPNTEILGAEEMRITCLGSGMPNLTRKSASLSYLVELGNGDKFLFDVGAGSMANLWSLRPDFSKIDKVIASHLHTDHVGDFMGLHIGSWLSGRYTRSTFTGRTDPAPKWVPRPLLKAWKRVTPGTLPAAAAHCLMLAGKS